MTLIREATPEDLDGIREVQLLAFPDGEGAVVASLATKLLIQESRPATISLVAETGGAVVGHVAFSPVALEGDEDWMGYILAPLGVKPEYHKRQVGSRLIAEGMARLSGMGCHVLFVYGDPRYYGKFGFTAEVAARYAPPYTLRYPFGWQAIVLSEVGFVDAKVQLSCVEALRDPELW